MIEAVKAVLEGLPPTKTVHDFPPDQNSHIEEHSWVIETTIEAEYQPNLRIETVTFLLEYWRGSASVAQSEKWGDCHDMRDQLLTAFGTPTNWGLAGTAKNLRVVPIAHPIRRMLHGPDPWVVLCQEVEAYRDVLHGQ